MSLRMYMYILPYSAPPVMPSLRETLTDWLSWQLQQRIEIQLGWGQLKGKSSPCLVGDRIIAPLLQFWSFYVRVHTSHVPQIPLLDKSWCCSSVYVLCMYSVCTCTVKYIHVSIVHTLYSPLQDFFYQLIIKRCGDQPMNSLFSFSSRSRGRWVGGSASKALA